MHKVIVLYNTPADPQRFRLYYENQHLPLAGRLPGLRSSRYSFAVQGPPGGPAPSFCIWEGEFADEAAAVAAMSSEIGGKVAADVPNYADGGFTLLHFTQAAGPVG
jgi:uncharacterized protein (TIGR02118 family)